MIYLFDFNGCQPGWYERSEIQTSHVNGRLISFDPGQILMTDPDLEAYASIVEEYEKGLFVHVEVQDVHTDRFSVDTMKKIKHYALIENTWILSSALVRKVHPDCFELAFGGQTMWTHSFGMGEPTME